MKKTIQLGLLFLFALTAFATPLLAQDKQNKELDKLAKKYENAYNTKDDKTIMGMYTKDATRVNTDGTVLAGSEAIGAFVAKEFVDNAGGKLAITPGKSETNTDGTVTSIGTYLLTGKSKETGQPIEFKGGYTNTLVKEGGNWKISKSVLSTQ